MGSRVDSHGSTDCLASGDDDAQQLDGVCGDLVDLVSVDPSCLSENWQSIMRQSKIRVWHFY